MACLGVLLQKAFAASLLELQGSVEVDGGMKWKCGPRAGDIFE